MPTVVVLVEDTGAAHTSEAKSGDSSGSGGDGKQPDDAADQPGNNRDKEMASEISKSPVQWLTYRLLTLLTLLSGGNSYVFYKQGAQSKDGSGNQLDKKSQDSSDAMDQKLLELIMTIANRPQAPERPPIITVTVPIISPSTAKSGQSSSSSHGTDMPQTSPPPPSQALPGQAETNTPPPPQTSQSKPQPGESVPRQASSVVPPATGTKPDTQRDDLGISLDDKPEHATDGPYNVSYSAPITYILILRRGAAFRNALGNELNSVPIRA